MKVRLHLHGLLVVLVAVIAIATASDRWVWSGQRDSRQLERVFPPFFLPPFLRPGGGPPPASAATTQRQSRRPKVLEDPSVADEGVSVPLRPTPRGVIQKPLVVRPLPLDISKLPLETSQAEGFLDVFAPHPPGSLRSSDQDLTLTLPEEDTLATLHLELPTPSLQTKTGHVEALVATPDISQLPLQSSSSSFSSFSPSGSADVGPTVPEDETPSVSSDAVLFPVKIVEEPPAFRTAPPPSSTPVPKRIFLSGFNGLDESPFLRSDALEEKRILKTLEALQKESLAQNSRNIKLAFQNLQRLADGHNAFQATNEDRIVFPKVFDSVPSESSHGGLRIIEPPRLGNDVRTSKSPIVFSLPVIQAQTGSSSLRTDTLSPEGSPLAKRLTTPPGNALTLVFKEPKAFRLSRKVPSYAWLWPDEASTLDGSQAFHQPASHAL